MVQTQQSMKGKHYIPGETKAQRKERKRLAKQTPPSNGKNYVACLKWGDKYTSDYVNKLYAMAAMLDATHITITNYLKVI